MLTKIKHFRRVYLASPYSKFDGGIEVAEASVSLLAAQMLAAGVNVYSPVTHSHRLARSGDIDAFDYNIWLPIDEAWLEVCDALVIAMFTGWE